MDKDEILESVVNCAKVSFSRSSGPGGQNVNKVNTRVTASVRMADIKGLTAPEMARLLTRYGTSNRDVWEAVITVSVQDERSQALNRTIALDRLTDKIANACRIQKRRHPTKPTRASKERRLKLKRARSEVKRCRRSPSSQGD